MGSYRGLAEGISQGVNLASSMYFKARDSQRLEDTLKADQAHKTRSLDLEERGVRIKELEFEMEKGAGELFNKVVNDEQNVTKSRATAGQVIQTMYDTAYKPKSLRDVDTLASVLKAQTGVTLAPNVIDAFKKASAEELVPLIHQASAQFTDNPDMGMEQLGQVLSNPALFNQTVTQLNTGAMGAEESSAIGAPPKRATEEEKRQKQVTALERRRDNYMKVADSFPTTKYGQAAFARAKEVQDRIDKMKAPKDIPINEMAVVAQAIGIDPTKLYRENGLSQDEAQRLQAAYTKFKTHTTKITINDTLLDLSGKIAKGTATPEDKKRYDLLIRANPMRRLEEALLGPEIDRMAGGDGEQPKYAAMPTDKTKLEKGKVYQTPKGPARWMGDKFRAVQ